MALAIADLVLALEKRHSKPSDPRYTVTLQRDIDRGTGSPEFDAFPKTNNSLSTVTTIFASIALGQPIHLPTRWQAKNIAGLPYLHLYSPQIPFRNTRDLIAPCEAKPKKLAARVTKDINKYLFLVLRTRRWSYAGYPNDVYLVLNKYAAVIHELASRYVPRQDCPKLKEINHVMDA
jgi:hypothetical protein